MTNFAEMLVLTVQRPLRMAPPDGNPDRLVAALREYRTTLGRRLNFALVASLGDIKLIG